MERIKLDYRIRVQFLHKTLKKIPGVITGNHLYYDSELDWISGGIDGVWTYSSSAKQDVTILFNSGNSKFYIFHHLNREEIIKSAIELVVNSEKLQRLEKLRYEGRYTARYLSFASHMLIEYKYINN